MVPVSRCVTKPWPETMGKDFLDIAARINKHLENKETVNHDNHGRGTAEDGPDDQDCPCRDTFLEVACAEHGCGFCGRGKTNG